MLINIIRNTPKSQNVIEIRASVEIKSHKHNILHAYFCDLLSNLVHRRLFLLFGFGV